jgi:threonylcarbamoyladenosine tRNA methylthiotransferase MtaB
MRSVNVVTKCYVFYLLKNYACFTSKILNKEYTVLFEHENKNGIMNGFTENYIKIVYPYDEKLVNQSVTIQTKAITEDGFVSAELVSVNV